MSPRRWVRALAVLYPMVTAFAVIATGNHFLLDILGGLLVMALSVGIVQLLGRHRASRRRRLGGLAEPRAEPVAALSSRPEQRAYRMSQTCYEVADRVD
jgi:membrane-associated phospholipid phosphatase